MTDVLQQLLDTLQIEPIEENLFRGFSPPENRVRVFGGQVAAQALIAAGRTVDPERVVHSLHAYFLRPGDPSVPIIYDVDRIRDGRSFTTRRVKAIQHGHAIFNLSASFHVHEPGPEHQQPMPDVAEPDTLPTFQERVAPYLDQIGPDLARWLVQDRPIDIRPMEDPRFLDPTPRPPVQDIWIRTAGPLPDDPLLHACVVAYASDLTLLDTAMLPHGVGVSSGHFQIASLDHAMWFHQPFRIDEWMLYHQDSPIASGARGFSRGEIFRRDGVLAVSVAQEGLLRPV